MELVTRRAKRRISLNDTPLPAKEAETVTEQLPLLDDLLGLGFGASPIDYNTIQALEALRKSYEEYKKDEAKRRAQYWYPMTYNPPLKYTTTSGQYPSWDDVAPYTYTPGNGSVGTLNLNTGVLTLGPDTSTSGGAFTWSNPNTSATANY